MGMVVAPASDVGGRLIVSYRDLIAAEARLGDALARRGARIGHSVVEQWPVLHDYLNLYARGLSPAGVLVLGAQPQDGALATGIPFTGPARARDALGLQARGDEAAPGEEAFWDAVARASAANAGAPVESLFGTVHLAHACPFDAPHGAEAMDAARRHVLRLLEETRPQAVVVVGAHALGIFARAVADPVVMDATVLDEGAWARIWPPGTPLLRYPSVEVPIERPFRARVVPVPALDGRHAGAAIETLTSIFAYAWAA